MGSSTPPHNVPPPQIEKPPQNTRLFKIWTFVLPFLVSLGLPAAIIGAWKDFFFQHPLWTIALFILCIIIGSIIGTISFINKDYPKETNKPFDDLIERLHSWAVATAYALVSQPLTRYRRALSSKYEILDALRLIKNLDQTLEFLKIFVHPNIRQNIEFDDVSSSPYAVLNTQRRDDGHTIEHFLTHQDFAKNNFVILGSPGSGKSALLQYITMILVKMKDKTSKKHPIPILLRLYDFVEVDPSTKQYRFTIANVTIADALYNSNQQKPDLHFVPIPRWLDYHLRCGHCLVMLDGLDAIIGDTIRPQVLDWIRSQMIRYDASRFILTSRRQNYQGQTNLNRIVRLEILSFKEEQIIKFVDNMFTCSRNVPKTKSSPEACLKRLRENEKIWELVRNPLLLSISASLHMFTNNALPKNRAELYEQIFDALVGDPQNKSENPLNYTKEQIEEALRLLAYTLIQPPQTNNIDSQDQRLTVVAQHIQAINPDATLTQFLQTTYNLGLLEKSNHDTPIYSLFHATMREYLTATYYKDNTHKNQELIANLNQPEWKEIILLYCAQSDSSRIVEACLDQQALDLALACEKDAESMEEAVRAKLRQLRESITTETDPVRRKIIATSRLEQLLELMPKLDNTRHYSTERYMAVVEYQLFVDQYYAQDHFYQPDHWSTPSLPYDQSTQPLLGMRSSDVQILCQSLTASDRDGWHYRQPTSAECANIDHSTFPPLTGYFDEQGSFHWSSLTGFDLSNLAQQVDDLIQQDCQSISIQQNPAAQALNALLARVIDAGFITAWEAKIADAFMRVQKNALDLSRFTHLPEFAPAFNNPQYIQINEFAHMQQIMQVLGQAVEFVLSRKHNSATDPAIEAELVLRRWSVRYFAWTGARMLLYWHMQISAAALNRQRQLQARDAYLQQCNRFIEQYLDLWIAFALLELRITHKIPVWEGVLLVKEFATPAP